MPDPFRLRVQKGVQAVLMQVRPAFGCVNDLSAVDPQGHSLHTARGRGFFGANESLPLVAILEPPQAPEQEDTPTGGTVRTGAYNLLIQGFAKDDFANPTDTAHVLLADVQQVLARHIDVFGDEAANNLFSMTGKIVEAKVGLGVVRPPDEISSKAYFWMILAMTIVEDIANPYS